MIFDNQIINNPQPKPVILQSIAFTRPVTPLLPIAKNVVQPANPAQVNKPINGAINAHNPHNKPLASTEDIYLSPF